jgi:hypothetical protein
MLFSRAIMPYEHFVPKLNRDRDAIAENKEEKNFKEKSTFPSCEGRKLQLARVLRSNCKFFRS